MNYIKQLTLSGILTSITILLGFLGHFTIGVSEIYLVGTIIFAMPLLLNWNFALISVAISVVLVDVISGWAMYAWISLIAYIVATIVLILLSTLKLKIIYHIGIIIVSIIIICIYYLLEGIVFDYTQALKEMLGNLIQFSIVVPIAILICWRVPRLIKHI